MKRQDLANGLGQARQALLQALLGINEVRLDGSRDGEDGPEVAAALERLAQARESLELIGKRLRFLQELDRLRSGASSSSGRWHTVSLVRLGVDCGYAVEDVNRVVEAALGAVVKPAKPAGDAAPKPPG